jgi:hypothetical protein
MIPSGRSRIYVKSEEVLHYASSPTRRIMFFVLFLMLGSAMVAGIDKETDFSGSRLLKTIGYGAVLLAVLAAAGFSGTTSFDRHSGRVEKISKLFGIAIRRDIVTPTSQIKRVVLQTVALLKAAPPGGRLGVFGNLFEPRSELHRLFLEKYDGRIELDESANHEELERTGSFLAEFLGTEFSKEVLS